MAQIGSDDDIILAHRVLLALVRRACRKLGCLWYSVGLRSQNRSRQIVVSALAVYFKRMIKCRCVARSYLTRMCPSLLKVYCVLSSPSTWTCTCVPPMCMLCLKTHQLPGSVMSFVRVDIHFTLCLYLVFFPPPPYLSLSPLALSFLTTTFLHP